jgi:LytS/YehU family sensor histidine kinase
VEKRFVENYLNMQQIRFSGNIVVLMETSGDEKFQVVPLSVQMLVENAIKHNIITADDPLEISIYVENNFLVVRNKLQLKSSVEYSENIGLENIKQQYEILAGQKAEVSGEDGFFTVKLPLITNK